MNGPSLSFLASFCVLLASCSANPSKGLSHEPQHTAEFSLFLKSESDFPRPGLHVFIDGERLGFVRNREVVSIKASAGRGRLTLNTLESGFGFSSTRELELHLEPGDRKFFIYDQTSLVFIEVSKEKMAEFTKLYPPTVKEKRNGAKELGSAVIAPIMLPGIVVFSFFTGQPVQ